MASYTIAPNSSGINEINGLPFPIPYVGSIGFASYNYLQEISSEKIVPYTKNVSTAQFISGNYTSFQSPVGYTIPAYTLPCFETSDVLLGSDDFTIFAPHKGYIVGTNVDQMTGDFPINIFTTDYVSNGVIVPPMGEEQSLFIGINKIIGSNIDWEASNVVNNGLNSEYIAAATYLFFEIQFIGGVYQIVKWIFPFGITNGQIVPRTITGIDATGNIGEQQVSNYNLSADAAKDNLGFTPVHQGGGIDQISSPTIYIGRSATDPSLTKLTDTDVDKGAIVFSPDGTASGALGFTPQQNIIIQMRYDSVTEKWVVLSYKSNTIAGRSVSLNGFVTNDVSEFTINTSGFNNSQAFIDVIQGGSNIGYINKSLVTWTRSTIGGNTYKIILANYFFNPYIDPPQIQIFESTSNNIPDICINVLFVY